MESSDKYGIGMLQLICTSLQWYSGQSAAGYQAISVPSTKVDRIIFYSSYSMQYKHNHFGVGPFSSLLSV